MSKKYKREAAKMKEISALAAAQPEEIRTRRQAAEETYQGVLNRLGAKGTYENVGGEAAMSSLTGAASAESAVGTAADSGADLGIFKTEKAKSAQATDIDPRYSSEANIADITKLDAGKTIKSVEDSAQFRIMSRLTAESEQLLAREGPLYDEMEKNLQNPIIEGSAAMARENAAELKRMMAKGGAARRGAFEAVQKMRQQEQVNSQRITAINQSRFALDNWARTNARTNLEFGQNWASNLGGVRESFNAAMDNAAALMTSEALPLMMGAQQQAMAYRRAAHKATTSGVMRWVKGIVGAVMMYYGAGQAGGALVGEAISGGDQGNNPAGMMNAVGAMAGAGNQAPGAQQSKGFFPGAGPGSGLTGLKQDVSSAAGYLGGKIGGLFTGPSASPVKTTTSNGWSMTGPTGSK